MRGMGMGGGPRFRPMMPRRFYRRPWFPFFGFFPGIFLFWIIAGFLLLFIFF